MIKRIFASISNFLKSIIFVKRKSQTKKNEDIQTSRSANETGDPHDKPGNPGGG